MLSRRFRRRAGMFLANRFLLFLQTEVGCIRLLYSRQGQFLLGVRALCACTKGALVLAVVLFYLSLCFCSLLLLMMLYLLFLGLVLSVVAVDGDGRTRCVCPFRDSGVCPDECSPANASPRSVYALGEGVYVHCIRGSCTDEP